jgi:hypothetical protein
MSAIVGSGAARRGPAAGAPAPRGGWQPRRPASSARSEPAGRAGRPLRPAVECAEPHAVRPGRVDPGERDSARAAGEDGVGLAIVGCDDPGKPPTDGERQPCRADRTIAGVGEQGDPICHSGRDGWRLAPGVFLSALTRARADPPAPDRAGPNRARMISDTRDPASATARSTDTPRSQRLVADAHQPSGHGRAGRLRFGAPRSDNPAHTWGRWALVDGLTRGGWPLEVVRWAIRSGQPRTSSMT